MKNKILKNLIVLAVAVAGAVCLTSCGATGNGETQPTRTVTDCAGVEVEIPEHVERVICVTQNAMEFSVAMGQESRLLAVHKSVFDHTWSPEYIQDLDRLARFGYAPAPEAVYESGADLVIVKTAGAAEDLRSAGIPAITFRYQNRDELFSAVRLLGEVYGGEAENFSEKWIACYQEVEQQLGEIVSQIPEGERKRVYFIDASVSMDDGSLCSTAGGNSIIATWFDAVGADLVTREYEDVSTINEEAVLVMDPESIVIGGWSQNTRLEQLYADAKWADVSAVKNSEVYLSPDGFVSFERYAVEAPLLLKYTAYQLYPELFDYDPVTDFQSFFREFYQLEVPGEKIGYMLQGLSPDGSRMD